MNNMAELHHITNDVVLAEMPILELMHFLNELTYPEMEVFSKEIYQNFATISWPFGTGHAKFLGIMMLKVLFGQSTLVSLLKTFVWTYLPTDKVNSLSTNTFKAVTQCLQNQFQKVIHKDYLAKLDNPDVGLTKVNPIVIYQHTIDWYAKIDLQMVEENRKKPYCACGPLKTIGCLNKKAGMLSSICCTRWQSNQKCGHGSNEGDACLGNWSHVQYISRVETHSKVEAHSKNNCAFNE